MLVAWAFTVTNGGTLNEIKIAQTRSRAIEALGLEGINIPLIHVYEENNT